MIPASGSRQRWIAVSFIGPAYCCSSCIRGICSQTTPCCCRGGGCCGAAGGCCCARAPKECRAASAAAAHPTRLDNDKEASRYPRVDRPRIEPAARRGVKPASIAGDDGPGLRPPEPPIETGAEETRRHLALVVRGESLVRVLQRRVEIRLAEVDEQVLELHAQRGDDAPFE